MDLKRKEKGEEERSSQNETVTPRYHWQGHQTLSRRLNVQQCSNDLQQNYWNSNDILPLLQSTFNFNTENDKNYGEGSLGLFIGLSKVSQDSKYTSRIWKCAMIGLQKKSVVSAGVRGQGIRDKALKTSLWESSTEPGGWRFFIRIRRKY